MSRVVRFPKTGLLPLTLAITSVLSATTYATEQVEQPYQLDKVVVTASSTEHLEATAPASITVVTGDEIREKSGGDIVEALRKTPGVQLTQGGIGGRPTISMRGLPGQNGKYTVMMVDGRRINASETLFRANDLDISTIPVDSIERVEIVRGPMSSLYGADALGGVINIITKPGAEKWSGSLSYDYYTIEGNDGGDDHLGSLYLSGPLIKDKLKMTLNADIRDRSAWTPLEGNEAQFTKLEDKDVKNISSVFDWQINEQQSLAFDLAKNSDKRKAIYDIGAANQKIDRETYALTHKGKWGWGNSQLRAYVEKSDVWDDIKSNKPGLNMENGDIHQTNQTLDGHINTEFGDHLLTTGAEFTKTELENSRNLSNGGKAEVTKKAIFAQDEWFINDSWTATLGGRLDNHSEFGSHFSPRGYLVYSATDALTLKGGVGTAYKAPRISEMDPNYNIVSCGGDCKIYGNPNLKPETSVSYELSAIYEQPLWDVSATVFQTDIKDMITTLTTNYPNPKDRTWTNLNEAQIKGVELTGRRQLTDTVNISANYAYSDSRDKSNGGNKLLTDTPRQTFNVNVDWQAMANLNTFVSYKYTGDQEAGFSRNDLPGYSTVDLGLNYKYSKSLSFRTGVTNVGDTRLNEKDSNFSYMERGRTYYVGATASF